MNFPRKVRFCVHFVPSNSHLLSISCYAINYNVHRVIQAPSTEPCMSWVVTQTMQRSDLQDATSPAFGRTISEGATRRCRNRLGLLHDVCQEHLPPRRSFPGCLRIERAIRCCATLRIRTSAGSRKHERPWCSMARKSSRSAVMSG